MKIDLVTLVKIGRAAPELTVKDYAAALMETVREFKRERDREALAEKRKKSDIERHPATSGDIAPSQSDMERQVFALGAEICGKNSHGMIAKLLKNKNYDVVAVRSILEQSRSKGDPRGYIAAACRRSDNGTGRNVMGAFDDLIARSTQGEGDRDSPILDLTADGS